MKPILITIFKVLILLVLIAKISNWFLHYSNEINTYINKTMFTLIGIAYLVGSIVWDKKILNMTFLVCGIYIFIMNFIPHFSLKSILGILCIILPLFMVRFLPETSQN